MIPLHPGLDLVMPFFGGRWCWLGGAAEASEYAAALLLAEVDGPVGGGPQLGEGCRIGEASNPGPSASEDDAEHAAPEEPWRPAWEHWSRPVWHPAEGGREAWVELVPPHLEQVTRDELRGEYWPDDEFETYLQGCEVEAGLRLEVDGAAVKGASGRMEGHGGAALRRRD